MIAAADWTGVWFAYGIGLISGVYGLAVLRNWHRFGEFMYRLTCSMPFTGYWRSRGLRFFQMFQGVSAFAFGGLCLAVATVSAVTAS